MSTALILNIIKEIEVYEVFINTNKEIVFLDKENENIICFSKSDWDDVREFIDQQILENGE
jgi:hypothetical protein